MSSIKKREHGKKKPQEQEVAMLMHKVTDAFARYQKQVLIAVSGLAALLVIMAGISLYRSQQEQKAAPLVAAAYEQYSPANMAAPDYGKALELFRGVQKQYSGTMSGAIAQYYVGNCLANLGRLDEAMKEYQIFIDKNFGNKLLAALVYQRIGYAYNALGKKAEAIKAFEQAESAGGTGVATIEIARLLDASGNMIDSQQKYKVVQEKMGGTSWGVEAMGKVQSISPAAVPQTTQESKSK